MTVDELKRELSAIFEPHPHARRFVYDMIAYYHRVDDIIDENITDPKFILETEHLASTVFSNPFYIQYRDAFMITNILVNINFGISVEWEQSTEDWKKLHSEVIRHNGNDILIAAVYIIAGYETAVRIAGPFREYSHKKHLGDIFNHETQR